MLNVDLISNLFSLCVYCFLSPVIIRIIHGVILCYLYSMLTSIIPYQTITIIFLCCRQQKLYMQTGRKSSSYYGERWKSIRVYKAKVNIYTKYVFMQHVLPQMTGMFNSWLTLVNKSKSWIFQNKHNKQTHVVRVMLLLTFYPHPDISQLFS